MWIFGSIKNERTSNKKIMFFELFLFDFVGAFFFLRLSYDTNRLVIWLSAEIA